MEEKPIFRDLTTDEVYPKTLIIRNTPDSDFVWQIYHVEARHEAEKLKQNAHGNGFLGVELIDYDAKLEQTWPDWRETKGGKLIIENK